MSSYSEHKWKKLASPPPLRFPGLAEPAAAQSSDVEQEAQDSQQRGYDEGFARGEAEARALWQEKCADLDQLIDSLVAEQARQRRDHVVDAMTLARLVLEQVLDLELTQNAELLTRLETALLEQSGEEGDDLKLAFAPATLQEMNPDVRQALRCECVGDANLTPGMVRLAGRHASAEINLRANLEQLLAEALLLLDNDPDLISAEPDAQLENETQSQSESSMPPEQGSET